MKFSTKGDEGYTSLLGSKRVPKSDPRPETYGTLDEASAALGLARATTPNERTKQIILGIQQDLLVVGAELATPPEAYDASPHKITLDHVQRLDGLLEELLANVEFEGKFVHAGENVPNAALHLGRTMIRRAERRAVGLKHANIIDNPEILRYLNRLADLLFTLALYEAQKVTA